MIFIIGYAIGVLSIIVLGALLAPVLSSQITRDEEEAAGDMDDAINWRILIDLLRIQGWRNVTPQLVAGLCPRLTPNEEPHDT